MKRIISLLISPCVAVAVGCGAPDGPAGVSSTTGSPNTPSATNVGGKYNQPAYHGAKQGSLTPSPVSEADLDLLLKTLLFTDEDRELLRKSRAILEPQVDSILDTWYGFVASTPHLLRYFSSADHKPQAEYLQAVRKRFGQWILDTADAQFDANWLAYQHEIGLRHHRTKKNSVDGAKAIGHIHFRYLAALTIPITETLRPFLEKGDHSVDEVNKMQTAWRKAVLLQVILWSNPYIKGDDF